MSLLVQAFLFVRVIRARHGQKLGSTAPRNESLKRGLTGEM